MHRASTPSASSDRPQPAIRPVWSCSPGRHARYERRHPLAARRALGWLLHTLADPARHMVVVRELLPLQGPPSDDPAPLVGDVMGAGRSRSFGWPARAHSCKRRCNCRDTCTWGCIVRHQFNLGSGSSFYLGFRSGSRAVPQDVADSGSAINHNLDFVVVGCTRRESKPSRLVLDQLGRLRDASCEPHTLWQASAVTARCDDEWEEMGEPCHHKECPYLSPCGTMDPVRWCSIPESDQGS